MKREFAYIIKGNTLTVVDSETGEIVEQQAITPAEAERLTKFLRSAQKAAQERKR
jgi:hypothetical protein